MRNMSFSMTTDQIRNRTKTVTRRTGWRFLRSGHRIQAVVKGMGLKKGEKVQSLSVLRVDDVRRERVDAITQDDVIAEGFPAMSTQDFIQMFCESHRVTEFKGWPSFGTRTRKCRPDDVVTRIAFSYCE